MSVSCFLISISLKNCSFLFYIKCTINILNIFVIVNKFKYEFNLINPILFTSDLIFNVNFYFLL